MSNLTPVYDILQFINQINLETNQPVTGAEIAERFDSLPDVGERLHRFIEAGYIAGYMQQYSILSLGVEFLHFSDESRAEAANQTLTLDPAKVAEAQADSIWIMSRFGKDQAAESFRAGFYNVPLD